MGFIVGAPTLEMDEFGSSRKSSVLIPIGCMGVWCDPLGNVQFGRCTLSGITLEY